MDLYESRNSGGSIIVVPRMGESQLFWTQGYLVLKGYFANYAKEALMLANELAESRGKNVVLEPSKEEVRSVFAVHESETVLGELAWSGAVDTIRCLLNDQVYIHQSRVNFKRSGGTGWGWHSDFETWHVEDGMPDMCCASLMIALTENTRENGALRVIPGSHNYYISCPGETPDENWESSLVDQVAGVPDRAAISGLVDLCGGDPVALELDAGDAVIFHCNLMHGSQENKTGTPRTNLFYAYNAEGNMLQGPFSGKKPRPQYAATRVFINEGI